MIVGTAAGTQALVLWDIDHTLIENDGVSKATYALAAELLIGHPTAIPPVTEGRTDAAIMAELLSGNGCDPDRFPLRQIWEALAEAGRRNEAELRSRGEALPGAAECLRRLAADQHVIQSTLTGNIEANAHVKLRAFGLDPWIDFSVGGYGVLHERPLLVPVAQQRAAAHFLDVPGLRERRWLHVQAVAAKAERIAAVLGPDGPLLVAAAWLHDIGYAPALADSG